MSEASVRVPRRQMRRRINRRPSPIRPRRFRTIYRQLRGSAASTERSLQRRARNSQVQHCGHPARARSMTIILGHSYDAPAAGAVRRNRVRPRPRWDPRRIRRTPLRRELAVDDHVRGPRSLTSPPSHGPSGSLQHDRSACECKSRCRRAAAQRIRRSPSRGRRRQPRPRLRLAGIRR